MDPSKLPESLQDSSKERNTNNEEDDEWPSEDSPQKPNMNNSNPSKQSQYYPSMSMPSNNLLPMTNMSMSNIDNLSINIINQYQTSLPVEELLHSSNAKVNVNNSKNQKSVAFDYYFGQGQTGNSEQQPKQTHPQMQRLQEGMIGQEMIGQGFGQGIGLDQLSQGFNKGNYGKEGFIPQQNKQGNQQGMMYKGQNAYPENVNMGMKMPIGMENSQYSYQQSKGNRDKDRDRNRDNNPIPNYEQMMFMQHHQHQPQHQQQHHPQHQSQYHHQQQQQSKHSFPNKLDINDQMYKKPLYNNNNQQGRFFVIKSADDDNIIKAIEHHIWCSTIKGNQKLQKAYKDADGKFPIFLFFSVNGSGKFMGLARMGSDVDYKINFNHWSQSDKWKGYFKIEWICIKDVPNRVFRNIINELNDNKPVTSSRDTQEIYPQAGMAMLKIFKEHMPAESTFVNEMAMEDRMAASMGNMNLNPMNQGPLGQMDIGGHINSNSNAFKGMFYQGGNNNPNPNPNMQSMGMMQGRQYQQQQQGGNMRGMNNPPHQGHMQNNQQFQGQMNNRRKEGNMGKQQQHHQQQQQQQMYGYGRNNYNKNDEEDDDDDDDNEEEDDNDRNDFVKAREEPKIPSKKIIQNPNKLQQLQQQQLIQQLQQQKQQHQHQMHHQQLQQQQQQQQQQMPPFNQSSFPQLLNTNNPSQNPKGFPINNSNPSSLYTNDKSMLPFQMGNIPLRSNNNPNDENDENDEDDDEEEEEQEDYNKINLSNPTQNPNQLFFNPKVDSDSDSNNHK